MKQLLIALALLTCSAESCQKNHNAEGGPGSHKAVSAPEIDTGSGIAALTLLAGALIVMRGRK
jgi:hypothetical protein